jgi:transposase
MNHHKQTPTSHEQTKAQAEVIKLGIDVHKKQYVVSAQHGSALPKPPQRFTPEKFLGWVGKLLRTGAKVVSCYEAGCFGYTLHRRLEAMGVRNLVVRPRDWDQYGSKVKTDARDSRALCSHLDRYLAGNEEALTEVRVPSEEEERKRSLSRQRDTFAREIKRLAAVGVGNARYYGYELSHSWWKRRTFKKLEGELPEHLLDLLRPLQAVLLTLQEQDQEVTQREERRIEEKIPKGLGALTAACLDAEFCDYNRFNNKRQVSSFTGLCPGEASSGGTRRQGSINKHGNPRIRWLLMEVVWRLFQHQPDYKPILYWKERMSKEPFGRAKTKKMAVAIARCFAVDWWRIRTGRIKAEDVGLVVDYPCAYKRDHPECVKNKKAA